jgi:hypothetical protein
MCHCTRSSFQANVVRQYAKFKTLHEIRVLAFSKGCVMQKISEEVRDIAPFPALRFSAMRG